MMNYIVANIFENGKTCKEVGPFKSKTKINGRLTQEEYMKWLNEQ